MGAYTSGTPSTRTSTCGSSMGDEARSTVATGAPRRGGLRLAALRLQLRALLVRRLARSWPLPVRLWPVSPGIAICTAGAGIALA
jgi:hypothetical protein